MIFITIMINSLCIIGVVVLLRILPLLARDVLTMRAEDVR